MKTQMTIGELFRRHRLAASLTQKELSDLLGYHNSIVSRVEGDEQRPSETYLQQHIAALHFTAEEAQAIWAAYREEDGSTVSLARQRPEGWGEAPDVSIFYGRKNELAELTAWVVTDACRLILNPKCGVY